MNYYNENDKFAANWLRELIKAKLIPNGEVDDRSIEDVKPQDLNGFTQYHFFAGIGGWPYALELSGWNADRPVWTGSCPCQPLSCAGKGLGEKDERHLWPICFKIIEKLRPTTIFGEQVASKAGREWFSGVRNDLEALGYAVGAADLPAASVGAPHKRNRLFWVGQSNEVGFKRKKRQKLQGEIQQISGSSRVADTKHGERRTDKQKRQEEKRAFNFWDNSAFVTCEHGKKRRVSIEPALFPLADGLPGRVGLLRGAGNAIVPQVAAEFIKAFDEVLNAKY